MYTKHVLFALIALLTAFGCNKPKNCDQPCRNGAVCVDGTCLCQTGYEGPYCQYQKLPKNILIEQIEVLRVPALDPNGYTWDIGSNPDYFATVLDENDNLIYRSPVIGNLAGVPSWPVSISINSPTKKYKFDLYDDDATGVEWMGGTQAVLYYASNGFPATIDLDCPGCPVRFQLKVKYQF